MDDALVSIAVMAMLLISLAGSIGYSFGYSALGDELLGRGLMEYCKHDGVLMWSGECSEIFRALSEEPQ